MEGQGCVQGILGASMASLTLYAPVRLLEGAARTKVKGCCVFADHSHLFKLGLVS